MKMALNSKFQSKWLMSYRDQNIKRDSISSQENFKSDLEELITCGTIEEFWVMLDNLQMPGRLNRRNNSSYMFFREGITPTWEDKENQNGGMWRIVLKRNEDRVKFWTPFGLRFWWPWWANNSHTRWRSLALLSSEGSERTELNFGQRAETTRNSTTKFKRILELI